MWICLGKPTIKFNETEKKFNPQEKKSNSESAWKKQFVGKWNCSGPKKFLTQEEKMNYM